MSDPVVLPFRRPDRPAATAGGLHVTHVVLSLDVGGLERNVVNQVREGQRLGQRVSVVCVERAGTLAPKAEALGARVISLDKRPGLRPGVVGRVRRALRQLRPDVVHTHHTTPLLYTGPAAVAAGVPVVVHTEHGTYDYAGSARLRWVGRIGGAFVRRFYCLTEDMAAAVAAAGVVPRRKIRVVHNGINTEDFTAGDGAAVRGAAGIPEPAPVVGTVGRLEEIKRQDLLLRAFARAREAVPDAHLMLVGDGSRREALEALAARLGLAGVVHFMGYREWTPPYLRAMTCFALTSRSEGMPQAVLEACVTGLPVIASAVGGIPDVIAHRRTGLLFAEGDEDALASGLTELLQNPDRARRLGSAAREAVCGRFDIRRMAREYHEDFLALAARHGRRKLELPRNGGGRGAGVEPAASGASS